MTYQSDTVKEDGRLSREGLRPALALIQDYHTNFYATYKELEKHYDLEMFGTSYFKIPKDINNKLWETKQIGRFYLANPFKLYKLLKGHKQAIIKDFSQPKSVIAIIICRLLGIKYSITLQKMDWFNKHPLLLKLLIKLVIKRDTPIIARITQGFYEAKRFFYNVTYIPFAIEKKIPNKYYPSDPIRVLCVGKLNDPNKNQIQLIKALNEVDGNFELTLVGSMKSKTPYYHKLLSAMLGSFIKVYLMPNLTRAETEMEYMKADLLILPTLREPANYSVLEAMSYGLPVISGSGNGTSCYIENKQVFWTGESKSLVETISWSLQFLQGIGLRNFYLARKNHNPEKIVKKMMEVIR